MNLANQITIARILAIPVFVALAIYYARSAAAGAPEEWMRLGAIIAFAVASISDALDGWVARHFHQVSKLGRILDPLADKLLLVSAVLTLSLTSWPAPLPLWFVIVIIAREVLAILGAFVVDHVAGEVRIQPHWTGKLATVLQMTTVGAAMLRLENLVFWAALAATALTLTSGVLYLADASRQVKGQGTG